MDIVALALDAFKRFLRPQFTFLRKQRKEGHKGRKLKEGRKLRKDTHKGRKRRKDTKEGSEGKKEGRKEGRNFLLPNHCGSGGKEAKERQERTGQNRTKKGRGQEDGMTTSSRYEVGSRK